MIRISGIVRLPDDLDGIEVVVQIANDRLVLKRARTSLGDYALSEVGVTQLSPDVFELDVDGEQVHFLPSNPRLFASLEFVVHATRRTKVPPKRTKPVPARSSVEAPEESTTEHLKELIRRAPRRAKPATPKLKPTAPKPEPPGPESPGQETIEVDLAEQTSRSSRLASRTRYFGAATRDQLRQTGIWPLDRLKALSDEDAHSVEHEHTYLVITTHAGLVRKVCTECGRVSLDVIESSPIEEN